MKLVNGRLTWIVHILHSAECKYLSCSLVLCHVRTSVVCWEIPNLKPWDHFTLSEWTGRLSRYRPMCSCVETFGRLL